MWADSKRSRRVSFVELRAAFVQVNIVHIRTFNIEQWPGDQMCSEKAGGRV